MMSDIKVKAFCTHCKVFDNTTSELEVLEDGKSIVRNQDCTGCSTLSVLYTTELLCKRCNSVYKMVYRKK